MKAYISVSFGSRKLLANEIDTIMTTLTAAGIEPFVFVDKYRFAADQEKQMMRKALTAIDSCGCLIAACTQKEIGIGVEAGYAKATNKPIVYLRHQTAEHSTTVSGISDYHIIYSDPTDLQRQLTTVIISLKERGQ